MYHRIVVVLTAHPAAAVALAHGVGLAKSLQAELLLVHPMAHLPLAVSDMPPVPVLPTDDLQDHVRREGQGLLDQALSHAQGAGVVAQGRLLDALDDVDAIAALARAEQVDLIVIGADSGNALMRLLTGSPVPGLISRAPVPVMVCHPHDAAPPRDS